MSILRKTARPLLALPFVLSGMEAAIRPSRHRERAAVFAPLTEKAGIELDERTTDRLTRALGAANVLAGFALASGRAPRIGALILAALQIPITLANNAFWLHAGDQRQEDIAGIVAGAGLIGGALLAVGDRDGKPSLSWARDNRARQREEIRALKDSYTEQLAR